MSSEYFIKEEDVICHDKNLIEEMTIEPDFPRENEDPSGELTKELMVEMTPTVAVKAENFEPGSWTSDPSVPPGWQYREVLAARKVIVKDPEGRKFHGRRNAILHLLETKQVLCSTV